MKSRLSKREHTEKEHFDMVAEQYDKNYRYFSPFTKYKILKKARDFSTLIKSENDEKSLKMLDVGCGTGEYTQRVAKLFPKSKIIGLDISKNILEVAKKKCKGKRNVSFVLKSAYNTDFKENSFDIIYGFYVLHHLDIEKFRREALRILKPGGLLFFYEPNILNPIVFLIKTNKYLKKKVGDSPEEWAINPLTVKNQLPGFKLLNLSTTEFVWPVPFLSTKVLKSMDRITDGLKILPFIKYLGGSVRIFMQKNNETKII
jgi:ubiquinone/menaquinone biosynthesis C-methylase UbiE